MRRPAAVFALVLTIAACGGNAEPSGTAPLNASPTTSALASGVQTSPLSSTSVGLPPPDSAVADPWAEDLDQLDASVRAYHPDPFAIHPESEWIAKLAELRTTLPTLTPDEQLVGLASLVGLLDTHSWIVAASPLHAYEVLFYPFSDGWFVIRTGDPTWLGARLVSIGGMPIEEVETTLRPLVPADNESGALDTLQGLVSYVEYLHGAGIVVDPAKPAFVLALPDGSTVMVDLPIMSEDSWFEQFGIVGDLLGDAPEAVARRTEPVWTRLDTGTKTFLISYNDYTDNDLPPAIAEMQQALDNGSADRVVLDMRYLRGGNGGLAAPLIDALTGDPRISGPGGLIVLIGRENVSAGTVVAAALERDTEAVFVGEATPARADNFLCECHEIVLRNSAYTVVVPTFSFHTGDLRDAIAPDIPMPLASTDFFAGRDPVLEAVLTDRLP